MPWTELPLLASDATITATTLAAMIAAATRSQRAATSAGNTGSFPVGRPEARNHSLRSSARGFSSGVCRVRWRLVST